MLYDIPGRFCWLASAEHCSKDTATWVLESGGVLILPSSLSLKKYKFPAATAEYCRIITIKILVDIARSSGNSPFIFVLFIQALVNLVNHWAWSMHTRSERLNCVLISHLTANSKAALKNISPSWNKVDVDANAILVHAMHFTCLLHGFLKGELSINFSRAPKLWKSMKQTLRSDIHVYQCTLVWNRGVHRLKKNYYKKKF